LSYLKFQADNIFTGTEMIDSSNVLITDEKGIINDIIDEKDAGENIQKHQGIISPGFINCHCHLELSHLKGVIPEHTGMVDFILNIMQKRASSEELIQDAIEKAEDEMIANGIVAVGDICNTTNTINQKKKGKLYYHNFIEISGFVPESAQQRFDTGIEIYNEFANHFPNNSTLVPHAPYSVSNNLFELIRNFSKDKISTIHNQESVAENDFFEQGKGDFERLYKTLGIDISFFKPQQKPSLASIVNHLTKASKNILVHNTFTSKNDIEILNSISENTKTQFYFCLCVLANAYITNSFPNEVLFEQNLSNIVLGTDSLASNHTLNLLSEIEFMKKKFSNLSEIDLLRFATNNGASALGIENKYGSFKRGKQPGIILIDKYLKSSQSLISTKINFYE
jgi:cytosine/adenosine deaminase-related metal-dependent hydrolase